MGNPGNAADSTGYGSVPYPYRIGTREVSNQQWLEFLLEVGDTNAVETLKLFDSQMHLGMKEESGVVALANRPAW